MRRWVIKTVNIFYKWKRKNIQNIDISCKFILQVDTASLC